MHVFLNPACHFGKGAEKWDKVFPEMQQYLSFTVDELRFPESLDGLLRERIEAGERTFIAAGGDGTVNLLANALMKYQDKQGTLTLGAIGLGGSNDFHKPFRYYLQIGGIPVRLNWHEALLSDIIRVRFKKGREKVRTQFGVINCSIGITARANAFCNSRDPVVGRLRRRSVEASVVYCALKTLFRYTDIPAVIKIHEKLQKFPVTNLGVIKNPHFAGGLCYGTEIKPDDGKLGVHLSFGMPKMEVVRTLISLYRHRFPRNPRTRTWFTTELTVTSDQTFAVEIDGEVINADFVQFELLHKALRVCS